MAPVPASTLPRGVGLLLGEAVLLQPEALRSEIIPEKPWPTTTALMVSDPTGRDRGQIRRPYSRRLLAPAPPQTAR